MENIIIADETFDFSKLTLDHPISIQGGAYFTKIEFNQKPLYIQTSKSSTKQGILKSGKKYYSDLMFTNTSSNLISWFEMLEEKCQELIFDKKDDWFQTLLDRNDIENAFNSVIKTYKSGKYYLVRVNIKNTPNNTPNITIYDESSIPLTYENVTTDSELISILEIQGIKFTSRNFQIEMNLRQAMIFDKEPIFDNCLIKRNTNKNIPSDKIIEESNPIVDDKYSLVDTKDTLEKKLEIPVEITSNDEDSVKISQYLENSEIDTSIPEEEIKENLDLKIDIEDLENDKDIIDPNNIEEITINTSLENIDNSDAITLRKPNQIYYELYKKAREKAKEAKKEVIIAYLEAKNIKNTYMLDNINDDYSFLDEEIDDVSESELEEFDK